MGRGTPVGVIKEEGLMRRGRMLVVKKGRGEKGTGKGTVVEVVIMGMGRGL